MLTFKDLFNVHASPAGDFEDEIALRSLRTPIDFTKNHKESCLKMKCLMATNHEHEG